MRHTQLPADIGKVDHRQGDRQEDRLAQRDQGVGAPPRLFAKGDLAVIPMPSISGTPQFGGDSHGQPWHVGPRGRRWPTSGTWTAPRPSCPFSSQHVIAAGDVGKSVSVAVTGTKAGYNPVNTTWATVAVAAASLSGDQCTLELSGKAKVGKKLTPDGQELSGGRHDPLRVVRRQQGDQGGRRRHTQAQGQVRRQEDQPARDGHRARLQRRGPDRQDRLGQEPEAAKGVPAPADGASRRGARPTTPLVEELCSERLETS